MITILIPQITLYLFLYPQLTHLKHRFWASWSYFNVFENIAEKLLILWNTGTQSSNLEIQHLHQTQEITPFPSSCTRKQYENDHVFCFLIFSSMLPTGYLNSRFSLLPSLYLTTKIYSATRKLNRRFMFHLSNLYFSNIPWVRFEKVVKLRWWIFHTYLICNSKEVQVFFCLCFLLVLLDLYVSSNILWIVSMESHRVKWPNWIALIFQ